VERLALKSRLRSTQNRQLSIAHAGGIFVPCRATERMRINQASRLMTDISL
jgi:hypothetical protein